MAAEKTINLSQKTYDRLSARRMVDETFDQLLTRILDELEQSFVDRVDQITMKR
jgi:hypothetical protein